MSRFTNQKWWFLRGAEASVSRPVLISPLAQTNALSPNCWFGRKHCIAVHLFVAEGLEQTQAEAASSSVWHAGNESSIIYTFNWWVCQHIGAPAPSPKLRRSQKLLIKFHTPVRMYKGREELCLFVFFMYLFEEKNPNSAVDVLISFPWTAALGLRDVHAASLRFTQSVLTRSQTDVTSLGIT